MSRTVTSSPFQDVLEKLNITLTLMQPECLHESQIGGCLDMPMAFALEFAMGMHSRIGADAQKHIQTSLRVRVYVCVCECVCVCVCEIMSQLL